MSVQRILSKFSGVGTVACAVVAVAIAYIASIVSQASAAAIAGIGLSVFLVLMLLEFSAEKSEAALQQKPKKLALFAALIPLVLFGIWAFFLDAFGYFNWNATLFHLTAGADVLGLSAAYFLQGLDALVATVFVAIGLAVLKARHVLTKRLDVALAFAALIANPMVSSPVKAVAFPNPHAETLSGLYVDAKPVVGTYKGQGAPKNVLHFYLESAERTYFEKPFGDVMQPLAAFEARGFSARNIVEVSNTNHSTGGAVATLCGMPLQTDAFVGNDTVAKFKTFLPRLTCLGDVLSPMGYDISFLSGWSASVLGQNVLYESHGYNTVLAEDDIKARAPGEGEIFGADDLQMLIAARQVLEEKSENDAPFLMTVGLSGGHAPDGFAPSVCDDMTGIDRKNRHLLHAVKCTNMLVADFLNKAQRDGLLENTLVILQSDHLVHQSTATDQLNQFDRRNFFALFGAGVKPQVHDRLASTMDIYPTILETLGFTVPDSRAGLGVSLLSGKPTLVEQLGHAPLNTIIEGDEVLRRQLWRPLPEDADLAG